MTESKNKNVIWGYHPVREALKAKRRRFNKLYLARAKSGWRTQELETIAKQHSITVASASTSQLAAIVGHGRHQGIVAEVSPYPKSSLEMILSQPAVQGRDHFILLLDQLMDPQNFGAIARTAYCAGVQGIILPKKRSAPVSPAAVKASAGALEHLHLAYVTNLVNAVKALKKSGVWIVGADREGAQDLFQADLSVSLGLIIGGEERGIRPLVKQHCDFLVAIPQLGSFNSLNASAAAAVILYESVRQSINPASPS